MTELVNTSEIIEHDISLLRDIRNEIEQVIDDMKYSQK